jgi:hypothetical protein
MTAGIAFAYDYPSTNEWNRDGENPIRSGIGPHVNLISADFDKITLEFVMPYRVHSTPKCNVKII